MALQLDNVSATRAKVEDLRAACRFIGCIIRCRWHIIECARRDGSNDAIGKKPFVVLESDHGSAGLAAKDTVAWARIVSLFGQERLECFDLGPTRTDR